MDLISRKQRIEAITIDYSTIYYSFESEAATEPIIHNVTEIFVTIPYEKVLEILKEELKKLVYKNEDFFKQEEQRLTTALARKEEFNFGVYGSEILRMYGISQAFRYKALEEKESKKLKNKLN